VKIFASALRLPAPGRPHGAPGASTTCSDANYILLRGLNALTGNVNEGKGWYVKSDDISEQKMEMDVEQFRYILSISGGGSDSSPKMAPESSRSIMQKLVNDAREYNPKLIEKMAKLDRRSADEKAKSPTLANIVRVTGETNPKDYMYNRLIHLRTSLPTSSALLRQHPLSVELDVATVVRDYHSGVAVIDDVLRQEVVAELRMFCLESTVWNVVTETSLSASWNNGLSSTLFLHVAAALRETFPFITQWHLEKYAANIMITNKDKAKRASLQTDIGVDHGRVNYKMWLTPDDANMDPSTGGLTVWPTAAPEGWSWQEFTTSTEKATEYREFLHTIAEPTKVAYKYNRAVLFDSQYFFRGEASAFKEGWTNNRISLTYLFGVREGFSEEVKAEFKDNLKALRSTPLKDPAPPPPPPPPAEDADFAPRE